MRKFAWLIVLLFLSACSLPFLPQQAAPAATPTVEAQVAELPEPVVADSAEEAVPQATCPACPEVPSENIACEDALEDCQASLSEISPVITELVGTIAAYDAAADSDAMPALTATANMQEGMPPLTATSAPDGANPTVTLEAMPATQQPGANYRADAITYQKNFAHPDEGCNWLGIAGQVLDASGNPVLDLVVVAEGVLQGEEILQLDITGLHSAYGPGGYEILLGNEALASSNMIYVTVYDLEGNALTSSVSIVTRADCNQNLLILNFQQPQ